MYGPGGDHAAAKRKGAYRALVSPETEGWVQRRHTAYMGPGVSFTGGLPLHVIVCMVVQCSSNAIPSLDSVHFSWPILPES